MSRPSWFQDDFEEGDTVSLRANLGKTPSKWMLGTGPEPDVAIASRVRLARNVAGIPFPAVASDEQAAKVLRMAQDAVADSSAELADLEFIAMADLSPLERRLLVERHLISPQHTQHTTYKGVLIRGDEAVSVMVNEEDHFRIQALFPGMQPEAAYRLCHQVDMALEQRIDYAFSEQRGYLTVCPTNVGTGLRASIMIHLPALAMREQIQQVVAAVGKLGLVVRGLYGEGSEAVGNIFQLSNHVTLGRAEEEIVNHLESLTRQVMDKERQARDFILSRDRQRLEDRVYRAYGILAHAWVMTTHEAMQLLSDVRLGIDLGLIKGLEPKILQELLVTIRPAHLQMLIGRELQAPERDVHRAALIRQRLEGTRSA